MTYETILERMNDKFTELSGYVPQEASDIGIRLRVLAGELFALNSEIDWLRRQMFPQTAVGEQLDLHAAQRGLQRRQGTKAQGRIVFEADMPPEYDVLIPAGTICSTADGSLRYVTVEDYTLHRGSTYLLADCEAEHSGKQYNIGVGKVKTIVTYFSVGLSIDNSGSFTGGTDDETDEELRERILESYRISPGGGNAAYFEAIAQSVEGIYSAKAYTNMENPGYVIVILAGQGAVPSQAAFSRAGELLEQAKPLGISLIIQNTGGEMVDVTVSIRPEDGYTFAQAKTNAEEAIRTFFLRLKVGEDVKLSELGKALLEAEGVDNYAFSSMQDVSVNNAKIGMLNSMTVTEMQ